MGNNESKALFNENDNLTVKEAGYYNFYIQSSAIYVTRTEQEEVEDGYYLRGTELGWEGAPLKLNGDGPYTVTRSFVANEKVQMVHYVDGLSTYVPAVSVTPADSNYFNAWKAGNAAQVEKAGIYTLSITSDGKYSLTDSASAWCREFLDSMTCTQTGQSEPVFKEGYSWSSLGESFAALDEVARNTINGATAVANGSVIQEAVSRYDTIVSNHGYEKFIKNSSDVYRTANVAGFYTANNTNKNYVPMIIIISSIAMVTLLGAGLMIKRRKEDR